MMPNLTSAIERHLFTFVCIYTSASTPSYKAINAYAAVHRRGEDDCILSGSVQRHAHHTPDFDRRRHSLPRLSAAHFLQLCTTDVQRQEAAAVRVDTLSDGPCRSLTSDCHRHNQQDLYTIIADIDSYSRFVPFCTGSKVTRRDEQGRPTRADLKVGYKSFDETFTSAVHCSPPDRVQATASRHPLFEKLVTAWRLTNPENGGGGGGDGCVVNLDIEYKFANPLYTAVSGAVLPKVADEVMRAFEKHAKEVIAAKRGGTPA